MTLDTSKPMQIHLHFLLYIGETKQKTKRLNLSLSFFFSTDFYNTVQFIYMLFELCIKNMYRYFKKSKYTNKEIKEILFCLILMYGTVLKVSVVYGTFSIVKTSRVNAAAKWRNIFQSQLLKLICCI